MSDEMEEDQEMFSQAGVPTRQFLKIREMASMGYQKLQSSRLYLLYLLLIWDKHQSSSYCNF